MWNTTTRRFCRSSVCCSQRTSVDLPAPSRPENVISIGSPRQMVVPEPQLECQQREDTLIQPAAADTAAAARSEEHTSELQSQSNLVCRLLLEKKKKLESQANDTTGLSTTQIAHTA